MSCEFHHPPCRRYKTALGAAQRPRWRSQNSLGGVEGENPQPNAGAAQRPRWRSQNPLGGVEGVSPPQNPNPTLVPPSGHAGAAKTEPLKETVRLNDTRDPQHNRHYQHRHPEDNQCPIDRAQTNITEQYTLDASLIGKAEPA